MRGRTCWLSVVMVIAAGAAPVSADRVTLLSGKVFEGKIISYSDTGFRVETDEGRYSMAYRMVAALDIDPAATRTSADIAAAVQENLEQTRARYAREQARAASPARDGEVEVFRQGGLVDQRRPQVELYMTDWCGYCRKMASYLRDANIPFRSYNVETDRPAYDRFRAMGGRGVPLIKVGDDVIRGYYPDQVEASYRKP